ncbi:MAG TPA: HNH endonuclease [Pirellulaceae bacterium]|jgi:hypothetical protein
MTSLASYWIVGAAQGGTNHHYGEFIREGFWKLFWADNDSRNLSASARSQVNLSKRIKPGDYIAIKKKLGGANDRGEVIIRAVGQVEKAGRQKGKIQVKWLATDLNKLIAGTGWGSSIHGPFTLEEKNVREVFSLICPHRKSNITNDVIAIAEGIGVDKTTKQALVNARLGQGAFGDDVLNRWDNRCAVTGSRVRQAINASHIKPWCDSSNSERLDPFNGLPLVASIHALFDAGYISFDDTGSIVVSSELSAVERTIYGITGGRLRKTPAKKTCQYLRYHRNTVFRR